MLAERFEACSSRKRAARSSTVGRRGERSPLLGRVAVVHHLEQALGGELAGRKVGRELLRWPSVTQGGRSLRGPAGLSISLAEEIERHDLRAINLLITGNSNRARSSVRRAAAV